MVGSLPDGLSLELHEGKVQLKGFDEADAGAQIRKNADGEIEWFVPSTETVDGLQATVGGLKTDVENAQADIEALEGLVGTEAVATQIDNKITALDLANTYEAKGAAGTAKQEVMDVIGEVAENKTVIEMIADAQAAATYDDTALAGRVKAIEDDHLVAADKTELEGKITAEKDRAEGIEGGLRTDVDAIKADYLKAADKEALQNQINTIMNNPDTEGVINSIEEFTQYIEDHGEIAEGFRTDIDANKKAIEDHEAAAALAYETKTDASAKLTEAKEYADGLDEAMDGRMQTVEGKAHEHANSDVLAGITADKVTAWDAAEQNAKDYADGLDEAMDGRVAPIEEKIGGIEAGAQVNKVETVADAEFDLTDRHLSIKEIEQAKIKGLTDALAGKVDKVEGSRLITSDESTKLEKLVLGENGEVSVSGKVAAGNVEGLEDWVSARAATLEGLSENNFDDALLEKLNGIDAGAQVNKIDGVSGEFTISADGKILNINLVEMEKVDGLADALDGKVDKVDGKGLSTNDLTDELVEKINASQTNVIETVQVNGTALAVTEKTVNVKATDVVKASEEVTVAENGTLGIAQMNVNKLIQSEGDFIIFNGGNAAGWTNLDATLDSATLDSTVLG